MRQCNYCGNKDCHVIHAPKVEFAKTADGDVLKPMELRKTHKLTSEEMQASCGNYKPIERRGSTILEHVIHNSPKELAMLLHRMAVKIIDVSYYPYFRIVPINKSFKKERKAA